MIYRRDRTLGLTACYADKTTPDHIYKLPSEELLQFRRDEKEIANRRKLQAISTASLPRDGQLRED